MTTTRTDISRNPAPGVRPRWRVWLLGCVGLLALCAGDLCAGRLPIIPFFLRGDVNGDRNIDIADLARLASAFSRGGVALPCLDAADVNDDGALTFRGSLGLFGGLGDVEVLRGFLLSMSPLRMGLELPAPFPSPGVDPTRDGLGCENLGGADPGSAMAYGFDWEMSPGLVRGARRQIAYAVATTGDAVNGLSYAGLVDTEIMRIVSVSAVVDDGGEGGGAGAAAPLFDWVQKPTADPNRDLLLLTFVYVDINGNPIGSSLTEGAVASRRVFRILFDVLETAPLGESLMIEPYFGGYAGEYGEILGIHPAFAGIDGTSQFPPPGNSKSAGPLIVGEEPIFLRGDSNADGIVNIADPVYTLGALFLGNNPLPGDPGDANDDGTISLTDTVYTLDFLFKANVKSLPEPYPNCGTDPTQGEFLFNTVKFEHCFSL